MEELDVRDRGRAARPDLFVFIIYLTWALHVSNRLALRQTTAEDTFTVAMRVARTEMR